MPPRSERNIQYAAPEIPSFLQKLHAQVAGGVSKAGRGGGGDDEWEARFAASSSSSRGNDNSLQAEGGDADDGDGDEWEGAQVVVLKEGRHLTQDEAKRLRDDEARDAPSSSKGATSQSSMIAQPSIAPSSKRPIKEPVMSTETEGPPLLSTANTSSSRKSKKTKREEQDPLSSVRALIHADRKQQEAVRRDKGAIEGKGSTIESKKERKRRELEEEKRKRGKGLSFGFED